MVIRLDVGSSFARSSSSGPMLSDEEIYARVKRAIQRVESHLPVVRTVASVDESELTIGKGLGKGAYCCVRDVLWNDKNLAMKKLRGDHGSRTKYLVGTRDLGTEAAILAGLDHPNIVKLHGIASGSFQERLVAGQERGFFVLIDKVAETLEHVITVQQPNAGLQPKRPNRLFAPQRVSPQSWGRFVRQRLPIALEVAQALQYLHKKGVMYRDLKPQNIGLDQYGRVKLLDFGFATTDAISCECAGSRAYMAPEVILKKPYTQSVDVYAFGILLWQLATLQRPFEGYSRESHLQEVVFDGVRPPVPSWWPRPLQRLLEDCWCPSERTNMNDVVKRIKKMVSDSMSAPVAKSKQVATVSICA